MLERRLVLSVSAPGIPNWIPEGPGPITQAQVVGMAAQGSPAVGATEVVLADPSNSSVVYAGTINGGVWKTINANVSNDGIDNDLNGIVDDESPTWVPLTDHQTSLSVGSLVFDPTDPTHNTLWAANGEFSSLNADAAPFDGLLKTTDGGQTWTRLGTSTLAGINIQKILPLSVNDPATGQQVVYIASTDSAGVMRSTDGGNTFVSIGGTNGMPLGAATDLAQDPANPQRIYAAVLAGGVFRSNDNAAADAGATWTNLLLPNGVVPSGRILLSVHHNSAAGTFALYAGDVRPNASGGLSLSEVFRYTPATGWTLALNMPAITDVIAGDPGSYNHVALAADNVDPYYFYVSGNRAPGQDTGAAYRGDALTNTWASFYNGTANGTAPHADSRSLAVDASGNVLQACDGGVYKLVNPFDTSVHWVSMNGNLSVTEVTSSAIDLLNDRVFASEWDNGESEQIASGGLPWLYREPGDGQAVTVDNNDPAQTIRYFHARGGFGGMHRREYDQNNVATLDMNFVPQFASATGQPPLSGLNKPDQMNGVGAIYTNRVAAGRLIVTGATGIYESFDKGDTIKELAIPNRAALGNVLSVVYGIASNPDLVYIQFDNGLVVRQSAGAAFTTRSLYFRPHVITSVSPGTRRIVVDPNNAMTIYAIDSGLRGNSVTRVWRANDGGAAIGSWVEITADLYALQGSNTALYDLELVRTAGSITLLVAGQGGVYRLGSSDTADNTAHWVEYGANLPNVTVSDLHYYPTTATVNGARGNLLVVGTLGRGTWKLTNVTDSITAAGSVTLTGTGLDDIYHIFRDGTQVKIDESLGGGPTTHYAFEYDSIQSIQVNTLAGNDSVTVDYTYGDPVPTGGISYDGGTDTTGDSFTLIGSAANDTIHESNGLFTVNTSAGITVTNVERDILSGGDGNDTLNVDATTVPNNILGGNGDDTLNIAATGRNLDYFPAISFNGGVGSDQAILWDTNAPFSDGWTLTAGLVRRAIFAGLDYGVGLATESVIVHGGSLSDDYQINSSLIGTTVTLLGGPGNDLFRFSPVAHDMASGFNGAYVINGGVGGNDVVVFRDESTSLDDNWTIGSTTVDKSNAAPAVPLLTYAGLESVEIDGGNGGTLYSIQGAGAPLTLNTGGGNDQVDIGVPGAGNLDFIGAPVSVDGGPGVNNLFVDDTANSFGNSWGVGFNSVSRTGFGGLSFFNFANLVVDAGSGGSGSLFNIAGVGFTRTTIFAGTGADTFNIANGPASIASLVSPLILDGGAGIDTVNLLDQPDTNTTAYTIGTTQILRGGSSPITFAAMEGVSVHGGSGINVFTVNDTLAATPVTLLGGGGNDTFSVTPSGATLAALAGDLTIDGETGANDQMFLADQANTGLLGNTIYNITSNSVQATFSANIHFANLEGVTLNASDGVSSINLTGTANNTPVTINGGSGADQLTVNAPGLLADVLYDGGEPSVAPGDSLVVNGGGLSGTYLPSGTSPGAGIVAIGARSITFRKLEPVIVNTFATFTLQTQNSSDIISITSGFGNTATGTSGGVGMESLTWFNITNFILDLAAHDGAAGASKNDLVVIQSPGLFVPAAGTFLLKGGGGSDKLIVNAGSYTFDQDALDFTSSLSVVGGAGAALYFNSDQHLAALTLDGATATLSATRHTMDLHSLSISGAGLLDLANCYLYIDNTYDNTAAGGTQSNSNGTPFAAVQQYVNNVYNLAGSANPGVLGDYAGLGGIGSSLAAAAYAGGAVGNVSLVAYDGAQQDSLNPLGIAGLALGPNSNSGAGTGIPFGKTLIRPTLTGDLNGDGVVDDFDITLFSAYGLYKGNGTGTHTALGSQVGDFNFDGVVDDTDILIFSASGNYLHGSFPAAAPAPAPMATPLSAAATPPPVPAPASAHPAVARRAVAKARGKWAAHAVSRGANWGRTK